MYIGTIRHQLNCITVFTYWCVSVIFQSIASELESASKDKVREILFMLCTVYVCALLTWKLCHGFLLMRQYVVENDTVQIQTQKHYSLISTCPSPQIMAALRDSEDTNQRLKLYIEGLLVNILDRHPELLERK